MISLLELEVNDKRDESSDRGWSTENFKSRTFTVLERYGICRIIIQANESESEGKNCVCVCVYVSSAFM